MLPKHEYDRLKKQILRRDGYRCRAPGCRSSSNLHVHHIIFRSQGGDDASYNLIVVCNDCHDKIHHYVLYILPRKDGEGIDANKGVRWVRSRERPVEKAMAE